MDLARAPRLLGVLALAVMATSCIGQTTRADFTQIVQQRGGGLSSEMTGHALDAITSVLPAEKKYWTLTIMSTSVVAIAQGAEPTWLDSYNWSDGDLTGPDKVPTNGIAVEALFDRSQVPLDRLERVVDAAIDAAAIREGYASGLQISGQPMILAVTVTNDRETKIVGFTADGERLADA